MYQGWVRDVPGEVRRANALHVAEQELEQHPESEYWQNVRRANEDARLRSNLAELSPRNRIIVVGAWSRLLWLQEHVPAGKVRQAAAHALVFVALWLGALSWGRS